MISDFCADELMWRPIELRSAADVAALEALLDDGWRIEPIGLEGLPYLAFCGREGATTYRKRVPRAKGRAGAERLLLILQRAAPAARTQRAVFVERGLGGYIDLTGQRPLRSRSGVAVFPIGADATLTIYELRPSSD